MNYNLDKNYTSNFILFMYRVLIFSHLSVHKDYTSNNHSISKRITNSKVELMQFISSRYVPNIKKDYIHYLKKSRKIPDVRLKKK